MAIVLDTAVLIDHLRGDEAARDAVRGAVVAGERPFSSVLTTIEVLAAVKPTPPALRRPTS
jgi:hypothetical protein